MDIQNIKLPVLFLVGLLVLLSFIIGVQYGKKVEKIDRKNLESLTATKSITISKSPTPTIFYKTFAHEGCLVSFKFPSSLDNIKESSTGASLSSKTGKIEFTCEDSEFPTKSATYIEKIEIASQSANLFSFVINGQKRYEFAIRNSKRNSVNFYIDKSLYKLVSESLSTIR